MKYCVSLEIAKKLKEAGWPQLDANIQEFYYGDYHDYQTDGGYKPRTALASVNWDGPPADFVCSAPTIGELLEATGLVELKRLNNGNYRAWNHKNDHEPEGPGVENPADALALLWIALKEKNLIPA